MKNSQRVLVMLYILILTSLFVGCGSAEAIKVYKYPTTKKNLERAVMKVIKSNPNIYLDSTTQSKLDSGMLKQRSKWTPTDSAYYYDNLNAYVRIKIKVEGRDDDYVFRFTGDRHNWESSTNSEIFISEVHDQNGNILSQGHNENGEFKSKMAKQFTSFFEPEFINKLDRELNLKHY
jgi:hypothetical protein